MCFEGSTFAIEAVAERGKETSTHLLFFRALVDPPYLPNTEYVFSIYVVSVMFLGASP